MQSSSSSSTSSLSRPPNDQPRSAVPPMYWCHECRIEMRPLMTPNPTCPRCNEGFVEEIDSASNATGMDDEDDDDVDSPQNFDQRPFMGAAQQFGSPEPPAIGSGLDLGSLMGGILRGLATAGSQPRTPAYEAPSSVDDHRGRPSIGNNAGNNGTYRSGTSQIGPITYSWGVGNYQHNSNTANGSSSNNAGGASGPSPLSLHDFVHRSQVDQHHRHHDDGMGGAGAAADGRFFNAGNENRNQAHDHPLSDNERDGDRYPPELASIRDVFANLFGAMGDGPANMLVDLFGGGSGRTGDYVWGQQGLDDVITQLMEQTRGSTAPPPATEEAIEGLPRFSRKDVAKVREARNRECSTCMDSFEEDGEGVPSALEPSLDSNRLTSTLPGASPYDMGADDPPETLPQDEQPDEVVMMPCKHLFHLDCLLPWLRTNRTCPVCRVSLESEKDKEGAKGNASGHSGNGYGLPSQGATTATADDVFTDDENEESVEAIRERSRRAAEARFAGSGGAGTSAQHQQRLPGSFLPPDDLD